jgi:prepilin-type N-terminal cleavage/methylation domain-containing protein
MSGACWSEPVCAEGSAAPVDRAAAAASASSPVAPGSAVRLRHRRGGFTFIELLTVVVVVAILAAIALPRLRAAVYAADAAAMIEEGRQIMLAGVLALQEDGTFPPDAAPGEVPAGLDRYLPAGFEFGYRDIATYTWSSESTPDGETAFLYIDYSGNAAIASAMRRHEGANAIWTASQMILFASQ